MTMNREFIQKQRDIAIEVFKTCGEGGSQKRKAISVVIVYLSSILNPDDYTEDQIEDIRKLALELGYTEETDFNKWVLGIVDVDKSK